MNSAHGAYKQCEVKTIPCDVRCLLEMIQDSKVSMHLIVTKISLHRYIAIMHARQSIDRTCCCKII